MNTKNMFLLLSLILMIGCAESKKSEKEEPVNTQQEELYFDIMPVEKATELFETADKVDVLFSDVSVSLSQVTRKDVQGQVSFLTPGKVPKKLNCSESANIIFQAGGEIVADGHMYLRGECKYVVFYENNEPVYAAHLTDQAMEFYRKILSAGQSTVIQ
jgi:hypothetical protein